MLTTDGTKIKESEKKRFINLTTDKVKPRESRLRDPREFDGIVDKRETKRVAGGLLALYNYKDRLREAEEIRMKEAKRLARSEKKKRGRPKKKGK